jgi:hypothetical protein
MFTDVDNFGKILGVLGMDGQFCAYDMYSKLRKKEELEAEEGKEEIQGLEESEPKET